MKKCLLSLVLALSFALPALAQPEKRTLVISNSTDRPVSVRVTPLVPSGEAVTRVVPPKNDWDTGFESTLETRHQVEAFDPSRRSELACGVAINSSAIFVRVTDNGLFWFTCLPALIGENIGCGLIECQNGSVHERHAKE